MKDCPNMCFKGEDILKPERKHMSENYLTYESKDFRKMCSICNMMQEHMASIKAGVESHRNSEWDGKLTEWDKNGFG